MKRREAPLLQLKVGQFGSAVAGAVIGAVIGGALSFWASWWQADRKDAQERQSAACVLGGELQVVHSALLAAVQEGSRKPEQAIAAMLSFRQMSITPSATTWGLAVKLAPSLAREISQFRTSLTGVVNSLSVAPVASVDAAPYAEKMLINFRNMAGVSGGFTKQLQVICERGGSYAPTKDDMTFTLHDSGYVPR